MWVPMMKFKDTILKGYGARDHMTNFNMLVFVSLITLNNLSDSPTNTYDDFCRVSDYRQKRDRRTKQRIHNIYAPAPGWNTGLG